jgi:hypothetical protein
VDADKELRFELIGGVSPPNEFYEDVLIPGEDRAKEGVFLEQGVKLLADSEGDVFFFVEFAGGAGVFATMARVNDDDNGFEGAHACEGKPYPKQASY